MRDISCEYETKKVARENTHSCGHCISGNES